VTTYASKTVVPIEKSRAEIEKMLTRYKATKFASGWSEHGAHGERLAHARAREARLRPDAADARDGCVVTVLAWLLTLRAPGPFAVRCDRLKVFYARRTWRLPCS
jgi:hypothetical protein